MDYRMNYSITNAFFTTKSAVKLGILNHKVHFGNYHLGSKYIYHLDKAINIMIFNCAKCQIPKLSVTQNDHVSQ